MKNINRKDITGRQYNLILGFFIFATLMSLLILILTFDTHSLLSWAMLIMMAFFALTAYCWADEQRYRKYEQYLTPVIFGLLFLFLVFLTVYGLIHALISAIRDNKPFIEVIAVIFGAACCGGFACFFYVFYLLPYFQKKKSDE